MPKKKEKKFQECVKGSRDAKRIPRYKSGDTSTPFIKRPKEKNDHKNSNVPRSMLPKGRLSSGKQKKPKTQGMNEGGILKPREKKVKQQQ